MIEATRRRFGSIDCIVVDGGPDPNIAAVICHGYGASAMDLAGLSPEWIRLMGERARPYRFVFPDAPHTLEALGMPDGHAWWPINMNRLMEMIETDRFEELHDQEPPGIGESTEQLCELIERVRQDLSATATPLVLGGFSQGAMLTMNASLCGAIDPPQLLFQFSGTIVCRSQWQSRLSRLESTPVFQSHGRFDPVLPFASAEMLHRLLQEGGVQAQFHSFPGPHTIDPESITITAQMLANLTP